MRYILQIAEAIRKSKRDETLHKLAHDQETEIENEVIKLTSDDIDKILDTIFPSEIPSDSTFYNLIEDIQYYAGFKPSSVTLVARLWVSAYHRMSPHKQKALLQSLLGEDVGGFWTAIQSLPEFCARTKLESKFATAWFFQLANKVKGDLAGGDVFNAVGKYAFHHPELGLIVFENYISESSDDIKSVLAAILLGTVRSCTSQGRKGEESVRKWDHVLQNSPKTSWRLCYYRSLISSFDLGALSINELDEKLSRMLAGVDEEISEAFNTVYRCLLSKLSDNNFIRFAVNWFIKNASTDMPDQAKYSLVSSMWHLCRDRGKEPKLADVSEANSLLVAIQPIPNDNLGTWRQLEYYLVDRLHEGMATFEDILTKLVDVNAEGLSAILREDHFRYLKSEMNKRNIESILTKYLLSQDYKKRMFGNLLFQQLNIRGLSQEVLYEADESQLWLILLELKRQPLITEKVSSYLLSIEPYFSQVGPELKKEFKDEMVMQAINYPGACLENWKNVSNKSDLLQEVIKIAEGYFDNLRKIRDSHAVSFSFPGYRKAADTHDREFSNKVVKGAHEKSIFAQLVKNVQIIYGSRWSIYTERNIGEDTSLSELSTSLEFPRLEIIDPEGMALRRLRASTKIRSLGNKNVGT